MALPRNYSTAGLVQYHDALSGRLRRVVAHARLRLSRLELIGGSGRTAGRYASAARAFISPTAFEQVRGEALWERVEAGSGSLGAASSESAAGSGRLRACGCSCGC